MNTQPIRRSLAPPGAAGTELEPEVVAGFVASVVRCLRATVGLDAVLATCQEPRAVAPIRVALEVVGDIRGPVTWVFPPAIGLELVRRLLAPGEPDPALAVDGATELANILTGRATEILESHGFQCEIGPPRVLDDATDEPSSTADAVRVRMHTPAGPIDLVLALAAAP